MLEKGTDHHRFLFPALASYEAELLAVTPATRPLSIKSQCPTKISPAAYFITDTKLNTCNYRWHP